MKKIFTIEGLCCPNCAASVERDVNKIDGVIEAKVNFITQKMVIEMNDEDEARITEAAVEVCKDVEPDCVVTY